MDSVKVFAPASVANLGPGFDTLGIAVSGLGDIVEAQKRDTPGVVLASISGDQGRLPRAAEKNTASIAASEALKIIGVKNGVTEQ